MNKAFEEKLKLTRKKNGMRQIDLAEAIGVSIDSITRWENGKRDPGVEDLQKLATALNTSVAYLIGETEDAPQAAESNVAVGVSGNSLVQCVSGSKASVHNSVERTLSDEDIDSKVFLSREEKELIRIYRALDIKGGHKLLDCAFKLEQGEGQQ